MPTDSAVSLKNQREKRSWFAEVSNTEKRLWARIHIKGVLDNDVKNLYHKACCIYEKLFICDNELPDLQNIEYLLWRLHYKHIDEFRKRISQNSEKDEDKLATAQKTDVHMKGFKLFLSEATLFYQDLIRKTKRYYGLLDEPWFYKNDRVSGRIEQGKLHKCQFVCHRFCICLGDLARYLELYEKPDNQHRNWSVAASYYLQAAKIYPDGGNPQNQLALLATYIGDEFLALYHCTRSLAVKEPFPDALQNLMLLFERNRSSNIVVQSNEVHDFYKPSEWISYKKTTNDTLSNNTTKVAEHDSSTTPTDLWTLIIRMTSFFFLETSLDSFTCTFTSTLKELEALLALDVAKLSSALESYQNMNLSKAGPYRALHIISLLLFIIHNLTATPECMILKRKNDMQQPILVRLALTVAFTFMGRFIDRCLKGSPVIYFPLLPALLVFVEWLVCAVHVVDANDKKCESAVCYFFGSLVELLNQLQENRALITFPDHIALWEDYELRGFIPLSHTHASLNFSSHWEDEINYKMKNEYRAHRIVQAAMEIAKGLSGSTRKWLFYDEMSKRFSTVGVKSGMVEEEEDIVFKPIFRHNSEPIHMEDQPKAGPSDDCLRRASSLLIAQNRALINSFTSRSPDQSPSSSKQPGQNEHPLKVSAFTEGPIAAGPPSLSSWVLNGEKLSSGAKSRDIGRSVLQPIQEMASDDFRSLSLTSDSSCTASLVTSPSTYCAPAPSAPEVPKKAVWFISTSAGFPPQNAAATYEPGVSSFSSYPLEFHRGSPSTVPSLLDHFSPWSVPQFSKLSSNPQCVHNHTMQSVYSSEASSFGLLDRWSYNHPLASPPTMRVESGPPLLHPNSPLLQGLRNNPRASPFTSPAVADIRPEPQPLLQYLKEREWQLQQESPFTGSPYMQN